MHSCDTFRLIYVIQILHLCVHSRHGREGPQGLGLAKILQNRKWRQHRQYANDVTHCGGLACQKLAMVAQ